MKRLTCALLLAFAAGAASAASSTVSLTNNSSWSITQLYLSAVDVQQWGPDQLGEHLIEPKTTYKLSDVPCDVYDVRLIDEDGDTCIVSGVKMCGDDNAWTIDDEDLLNCQAETAK